MARLSDEALEKVFSRLKPYCVDLLDLLRNPKKSPSFLRDMADFLRQAPPEALQPSVDYTMFPLLLLLDASVRCRSGDKGGDLGGAAGLEIADSAAEGVLMCLEELLKKCHLGSVNQMVVVLKKLTSGALLSPTEAAEEFREGVIRCLRAMLFRIKPCSIRSCTCRNISFPTIIGSLEAQYSTSLKYYHEPEECLLAFFQSQNASAAVGHWLSLLLQIAESEVVRGHRGSSNLRKEALLTLRVLVAKIGTADALAFFLPGIVSRFTKALHVSKGIISGAGGNTGSIEHAVRGLTEFLMIVLSDKVNLHGLEMSMDDTTVLPPNRSESTVSVLEALRQLPVNAGYRSENSEHSSTQQAVAVVSCNKVVDEKNNGNPVGNRTLYVHRTKEWIDRTSEQVDKLLSATFPQLSTHPAEKVRKGLVDGISGLLTNCYYTLKRSKLMLLECLCILICDDSAAVSVAAQESLESLFVLGEKFLKENEISELFTSYIEKLPRMVLGSEEAVAVSHARRLLALMYYAGPELVVYHLLSSPFKAGRFLEFLGLSFSHNSQFAGSFEKLISSKPLSIGYLLSVAELKSGNLSGDASHAVGNSAPPVVFEISDFREHGLQHSVGNIDGGYELPHMPPWFSNIGSEKLYVALAGILRLSGLSIVTGHKTDLSLSSLVDILLDYFRKLISELRIKDYYKEGWQTWYTRSGSGRLLRETSSAVCMLNEIIYGLSDRSVNLYSRLFSKTWEEVEGRGEHIACDSGQCSGFVHNKAAWKVDEGKDARDNIIHCIGSILHEYMSPEVWELPVDQKSPLLEHANEAELSLHFLRDATILHQVIIEGIGIFGMVLGKDFIGSGFMHSTLYLLLQKLICSNSLIRIASDAVLQVLSAATGHTSVGHLVVANADYILDSLCRQLRHLDLNPHVPDVFAAMLSYIGAAREILPLLEEPMRAVSSELEVLGRHQNPHLTIPFLKAVNEITKASSSESSRFPYEAEALKSHVKSKILSMHDKLTNNGGDAEGHLDQLEEFLSKLNEMRRYRRIVASLVGSCLKAAIPLLSSLKEPACLVALNIVEDVTLSLATVEEAYKHEKETKASIERVVHLISSNDLEDELDTADDETDENRLLPAMNKIWPYLILCLKNKVSVAVIRRCTSVLSRVVLLSGGDFFIRRFHTDGHIILKLLASSPFRRKPMSLRENKQIILPYRSTSLSSEDPMAEVSSIKIQIAILNMIAELSSNKRSSSAIEAVLKKVSGIVVGIAYSGVSGLQDASLNALSGLARIDPDLVWLLLADVYYSLQNKDLPLPPTSDLPEMYNLLPPPLSPKDYLYMQYAGEISGFDLDPSSVELVFQKMQSLVFT